MILLVRFKVLRQLANALAEQRDLSTDEATDAIRDIVNGAAPPEVVEQFAAALRAKGAGGVRRSRVPS